MQECFILLNDDEYNKAWDMVKERLHFSPSIKNGVNPFIIQDPFVLYDISKVSDKDIDNFDEVISGVFSSCIGDDEYIYALDWQHSGFRYNPRVRIEKHSLFVNDERYFGGGYNAFFPGFFPDGDYYFFISKNCEWGYLGHPWQLKVWVFGKKLIKEFEKVHKKIGFIKSSV